MTAVFPAFAEFAVEIPKERIKAILSRLKRF